MANFMVNTEDQETMSELEVEIPKILNIVENLKKIKTTSTSS
jgi:hypothetical protein